MSDLAPTSQPAPRGDGTRTQSAKDRTMAKRYGRIVKHEGVPTVGLQALAREIGARYIGGAL